MFLPSPFSLRDKHYVFLYCSEKFNFHVHTKHALKSGIPRSVDTCLLKLVCSYLSVDIYLLILILICSYLSVHAYLLILICSYLSVHTYPFILNRSYLSVDTYLPLPDQSGNNEINFLRSEQHLCRSTSKLIHEHS